MIAAVQIESNAFDSMREKLKELDASRNQLTTLTKRLLEADQANLTLKGNLIKLQEAYSELRRSKAEVSKHKKIYIPRNIHFPPLFLFSNKHNNFNTHPFKLIFIVHFLGRVYSRSNTTGTTTNQRAIQQRKKCQACSATRNNTN